MKTQISDLSWCKSVKLLNPISASDLLYLLQTCSLDSYNLQAAAVERSTTYY